MQFTLSYKIRYITLYGLAIYSKVFQVIYCLQIFRLRFPYTYCKSQPFHPWCNHLAQLTYPPLPFVRKQNAILLQSRRLSWRDVMPYSLVGLHGVTSQKICFIITAVRKSNLRVIPRLSQKSEPLRRWAYCNSTVTMHSSEYSQPASSKFGQYSLQGKLLFSSPRRPEDSEGNPDTYCMQ
jgi:hypothetical protein